MKISKLIIFDLDGTFFQTDTVDVEAFNQALTLNGYKKKTRKVML